MAAMTAARDRPQIACRQNMGVCRGPPTRLGNDRGEEEGGSEIVQLCSWGPRSQHILALVWM